MAMNLPRLFRTLRYLKLQQIIEASFFVIVQSASEAAVRFLSEVFLALGRFRLQKPKLMIVAGKMQSGIIAI